MSAADALRHDIQSHREELSEVVDLLADKLDVKARAAKKVESAKPYLRPVLGGLVVLVIARKLRRRRS